MVIDNMKNHDRIIKIINDYWNNSKHEGVKNFYKNVIDIRFVCEFNKNVKDNIITGVRINNIYISCNQLEEIVGEKILGGV